MRNIQPALVKIIDHKLKTNTSAQEALKNGDARSLLVCAAEACVGEKEAGGPNRGSFVELCQKTVDNVAQGESWCMSFVESMIAYVETKLGITSPIASAENCLQVWENTPDSQMVRHYPLRGAVVLWRHARHSIRISHPENPEMRPFRYDGSGHTGFVLDYKNDQTIQTMTTIEGNTNEQGSGNGDGVYIKQRKKLKEGGRSDLEVVGFLKPF